MTDLLFRNGEKLLTIPEAANVIGVPAWKLRAAVRENHIPSYNIFNKRSYVLVSEVLGIMRHGGANVR